MRKMWTRLLCFPLSVCFVSKQSTVLVDDMVCHKDRIAETGLIRCTVVHSEEDGREGEEA
jgi:hypothetical protein